MSTIAVLNIGYVTLKQNKIAPTQSFKIRKKS